MREDTIQLFDGFTLDLARGCLLREGEEFHLRPQSYEVLKYLAENKGRLISKDKLIEEVWQGRAVTDGSLGKCIEEVREALGVHARHYVRNVRGRGYILDPELVERNKSEGSPIWTEQIELLRVMVEDEEERGELDENDQSTSQFGSLIAPTAGTVAMSESSAAHTRSHAGFVVSRIKRHKRAAVIAVAALAIITATLLYFTRFASRRAAIRSVAVLPFANGSGDPNLEYLSDGLSESLIDRLSQLPQLKVTARSSAFMYKGRQVDPREAARALGVEALVTGRVVQRGDDLQIRAELVDTRDGTQVWGEQYSRRAADMQAVQEEISSRISERLLVRLGGAQDSHLTKRATENSQAYQFYLNGLFHLRKGGFEDVKRALDYFTQAVSLDANFALAWAGVAHANRYFSGNSLLDPKESLAKAKAAALKALELDETLAEAHVELAGIKQDDWDWAGAQRHYKRAVELNPSLVEAHTRYSLYLSIMERHAEALAEIKTAEELDPLRVGLRIRETEALMLARQYDEAIELYQSIRLETNTGTLQLGSMYEAKGRYERAINEYRKAVSVYSDLPYAVISLGHALAMSDKKGEAREILDKLKSTKKYVSPAELAILYVGLGDKEGALASLEKAYAARDLQLQYLKLESRYDSLRLDPRFRNLVRRVGLPE